MTVLRVPSGPGMSFIRLLAGVNLVVYMITIHYSWQDAIIDADNAKYNGLAYVQPTSSTDLIAAGAAAMPASTVQTTPTALMIGTAEDMENNTAEASGSSSATFSVARACAVPVNFPAHTMNGEVRISELGDVASVFSGMPDPY